jgi:hypothetical protein
LTVRSLRPGQTTNLHSLNANWYQKQSGAE